MLSRSSSRPWEIAFHLAAEFATAFLLLAGGIAVLKSTSVGRPILLTGLGMVIYSEIVSPGYLLYPAGTMELCRHVRHSAFWSCVERTGSYETGIMRE